MILISDPYRSDLLALPRVGEQLLRRLERAGFHSLESLARSSVSQIMQALASHADGRFPSGAWVRSSIARNAIGAIVSYARKRCP